MLLWWQINYTIGVMIVMHQQELLDLFDLDESYFGEKTMSDFNNFA